MSENSKEVLKVHGYIYKIFPTQEFKNDFTKREFILETRTFGKDGKEYKNLTKMNCTKSFTSMLDGVGIGSEVVVCFALDGREWINADKEVIYITSLRAWDIKVINNTSQERADVKPQEQGQVNEYTQSDDETGDLPFSFVLPLVGMASAGLANLISMLA